MQTPRHSDLNPDGIAALRARLDNAWVVAGVDDRMVGLQGVTGSEDLLLNRLMFIAEAYASIQFI
jgi:hypothetical protein